MTLPLSIVTDHYAIAFPFDHVAGKAKFWAHAAGVDTAVGFDFMVHDNPNDPRPYRFEVIDVDNDQLLPKEVLSALMDQDFFVSSSLFEATEPSIANAPAVLQTSGGFNNLLWAGSPEVVRELLASMTDHDRGVGVYRSNQHDQYVSVQFNTRSAAFAEDDIAPLGVRHREILTVLKGLADNLPAIVSDLRAGSTPTESVAHVICDSNGEGIGELWLRQARDDVAALKKGAVGLLFPMSCVKDADCSQGSALLRDAANQLRARGLCDEFEIAGDLQMMIRAPKGEKLNDHIARRLAGVVPDSFDMDELVTLISHAREINVNPDSNAPGIPVCVVSSNDGAAVETESDVMPGH